MYAHTYAHSQIQMHTHTYTCIYSERERVREGERGGEKEPNESDKYVSITKLGKTCMSTK